MFDLTTEPVVPNADGAVWTTLRGALDALEQGAAAGWYPARRLLLSRLAGLPQAALAPWVPEADVVEDARGLIVSFDLPGVEKEELRVEATEQLLIISGRRSIEVDGRAALRQEKPHGRFLRRIALPAEVKPAGARAFLRNGVLTVILPRSRPARGRSVKVR